jgi:transmembrane E3 ubiquitin-protein ligase
MSQHITFAILADGRPSMALVAPAFLACALFSYEVVRHVQSRALLTKLIFIQQFVLLIQQVQAPEDLAALPPVPSPQSSATSPSPSGVPTSTQADTPPISSLQPPPRPLLSLFRMIFWSVWYDEHNRICAQPLLLRLIAGLF